MSFLLGVVIFVLALLVSEAAHRGLTPTVMTLRSSCTTSPAVWIRGKPATLGLIPAVASLPPILGGLSLAAQRRPATPRSSPPPSKRNG